MLLLCPGFSLSVLSQTMNDDTVPADSIIADSLATDSISVDTINADSIMSDSGNMISAAEFANLKKKVDKIIEFRSEEEFEQLVAEGIELFNGTTRLENKGPSCISCHVLNYPGISQGGFLGIDLSNSYTTVNKEKGLQIILKSPTAPAMKTTYSNNPFTYEETRRLVALLKKADEEKDYHLSSVNNAFVLIYGVAGFMAILIVMLIIWRNRIKRSVKEAIYKRQIKTG